MMDRDTARALTEAGYLPTGEYVREFGGVSGRSTMTDRPFGCQPDIEIRLPFPPSVNELYFNPKNWRGRVCTPTYEDWKDQAGWELKAQRPPKIKNRCIITIELDDTRNGDAANREKAVTDLLVAHGILVDDSKKYVKGIYTGWETLTGCRVRITEIENESNKMTTK